MIGDKTPVGEVRPSQLLKASRADDLGRRVAAVFTAKAAIGEGGP